jgi:ubiquinone/menaquinone biosynthesis C-methylase UbiE
MMKKLNLGCGEDVKSGYVNMDLLKLKGVDVVHDINKFPWPFKENEFDLVYTSHVIEHVDDLVKVMAEIRRICKPKARIHIRVPHFSCGVSYRDPTHKRLFSYFTFDYFTEDCFYGLPKFKIINRKLNFTRLAFTSLNYLFNPIINLNPALYERFGCWILPTAEVIAELEVDK